MSVIHHSIEESIEISKPGVIPSPRRSLAILAIIIFLAELVTMLILYYLRIQNYLINSLVDGLIMMVLILPGLYLLQMKPLIKQIEERTRVENALRVSGDLMEKVLELLPVGVWILEKHKRLARGNPASQNIWASSPYIGFDHGGEFKGWLPGSGKPLEREEWPAARAVTSGETTLNQEIEIEAFDGSRKTILNSAVPILNEKNEIDGAVVVDQDITNRKKAEKERIRTEALLERYFSSIYTLIAYMDRDFNFIRVNDTYAHSGGHSPDYFIGKNHFDLYPNDENFAIFQRVIETGEPFSVLEKPFQYSDFPERGVTYWDWSLQPVKGADDVIEGVVLSLIDATERKHSEILQEKQNQELLELYKAESMAREFAETLSAAARALTGTLDLDHVINTLLDYLNLSVPSDTSGVTLLEAEEHPAIHTLRGYGIWEALEEIPSFPHDGITDSVLQRLILTRKSLTIPNIVPYPEMDQVDKNNIRTWLVVPIIASEKVIGWVELGKSEGTFTPQDIDWAEALVTQAGVALQNAWLFEQVRSSSERLQILAHKLVKIQENERHHIARELHDEAGQLLSSLKLSLGRLEQDRECPQHIRIQLRELKGIADGILDDLHQLAVDLRPVTLDHLGLIAALEQYVVRLNSDQLSVKFKAVGFDGDRMSRDVETSLYRIVQEALTNVISHANASYAGVLLERTANKVRLFIEDDGVGFSPDLIDTLDRLGLVGMRERAEMLGGNLTIESTFGRGTSVIVEVPDAYTDPYRG